MTLLRMFRNSSVENPAVPLTATTLINALGGGATDSGVSVTEKSALGMPAVWCAVNLISGTAAALPLHAYRKVDDVRLPLESGQAARLLDEPHPDMTPFELWETVYAHVLLWGNAYLRILRNQAGQVSELWPIHPSRVRVGRADDGSKWYQLDDDDRRPYTDAQILHIPGFGYDGICGVSPIRLFRQGIGLAQAAETYGAKLFGSGSLMTGILQTEQRLDQASADQLKARWRAKMTGLAHAHEVAVLDSGAKFQALSMPPEDAQFIQSRSFQISEVARMFGVPPHLLMDTDKSTSWGTGIEQQTIGWAVFGLRRYTTRVEQRLTRILRPSPVYAKYAFEGLLRGDSAARSAFYKALWEIGVLSTNDIRSLEDLAPVVGGDVRYRPLNFGVLGEPDAPAAEPATQADVELAARMVAPPVVNVEAPIVNVPAPQARVRRVERDEDGAIVRIIDEEP